MSEPGDPDEGLPEAVPEPQVERALTPTSGTRRVPPNPDAPKLRARTEKKIAVADQKSAEGYDALDASREKIARLKSMIEGGQVQVVLEVGDTAVHTLKGNIANDDRK